MGPEREPSPDIFRESLAQVCDGKSLPVNGESSSGVTWVPVTSEGQTTYPVSLNATASDRLALARLIPTAAC